MNDSVHVSYLLELWPQWVHVEEPPTNTFPLVVTTTFPLVVTTTCPLVVTTTCPLIVTTTCPLVVTTLSANVELSVSYEDFIKLLNCCFMLPLVE